MAKEDSTGRLTERPNAQPKEPDGHDYEDLLDLPHPISKKHPPMPLANRAAQFAPFAALTGFGAAITETGRVTQEQRELDEDEKAALNRQLLALMEQSGAQPRAAITYFQADARKSGGAYVTVRAPIRRSTHTNASSFWRMGKSSPSTPSRPSTWSRRRTKEALMKKGISASRTRRYPLQAAESCSSQSPKRPRGAACQAHWTWRCDPRKDSPPTVAG